MWYNRSISNLVGKLYRDNKPLTLAVFLALSFLVSVAILARKTGVIEEKGIGAASSPIVSSAQGAGPGEPAVLVENQGVTVLSSLGGEGMGLSAPLNGTSAQATLADTAAPIGPSLQNTSVVSYKVQKGDTLAGIASNFGVTAASIQSENPGMRSKLTKGETLTILSTPGAVYTTQNGDTLESLSQEFNVPENTLTQFNQSVNFVSLNAGINIVIPGVTQSQIASAEASVNAAMAAAIPVSTDLISSAQTSYNWSAN